MVFKFLSFIILIAAVKIKAQNTVFGNVSSENEAALSGVLIINITHNTNTISDAQGYFSLQASPGDEVRFVRKNYSRLLINIKTADFGKSIKVEMQYVPQEIEEVVVQYRVTGNLNEDSKHFGTSKKVIKLNTDLGTFIRQPSALSVMKPKINDFVQPKGKGFETRKIGYKWDTLNLVLYLNQALGDAYFTDMGLQNMQIIPFIQFTLKFCEINDILRFGRINSRDVALFQAEAERQVANFNKRGQ